MTDTNTTTTTTNTAKPITDESKHYVTNKSLMAELYKWRDTAENPDDRVISEELGLMMYTIAKRLTNHYRFRGYSEEMKQDMISFGCYKAIKIGLKNYNFEFTKPFAYFTTIFWNANVSVCAKYYKHKNGMKKYIIDTAHAVSNSMLGGLKSTYLHQIQRSLEDFLSEFEEEGGAEETAAANSATKNKNTSTVDNDDVDLDDDLTLDTDDDEDDMHMYDDDDMDD